MRTIWHDIRFGLRQLRRSPGFTAVAILSLALGIGANTAIFSLINGILLKSLPVRNPHELRVINWISHNYPDINRRGGDVNSSKRMTFGRAFPYPAYREFAEKVRGSFDVFAFHHEGSMTINDEGAVSLANVQMVSGNFFKAYGAQVLIGRPITPEDDRPDAEPVTVLTYPFWQRVYGLDPHVIGRTLTVDDKGLTVIGVLPRDHADPLVEEAHTDFYVPIAAHPRLTGDDGWLNSDNIWWIQMMGRLAPGANEAQVQNSLGLLFSHVVNRSEVEFNRPGVWLQKGQRGILTERLRMAQPLLFLQGVVGLVLLIACTNLAGLLLARGVARQHEMAVRAAMGAGRWRLIRQSLTESMILSLGGVCFGLALSTWVRGAVSGFVFDPSKNQHFDIQIDSNVLVFAVAVGVVTTLLSGLFPALRAGKTDPSSGLKDSGSRGASQLRLGNVFVTAQVGLSVILVVVGGLLCQTLINLYRTEPGFDTENILLVRIEPFKSLHPARDTEGQLNTFNTIRQEIAGIPGVRSVAYSSFTLLEGRHWGRDVSIPGRSDEEPQHHMAMVVSEGYFATLGINLLTGRDFRATDREDSQQVVIVDEEFGREFFPDENPLGQFIMTDEKLCQIVGICSNQKYSGLRQDIKPILYLPHSQKWCPGMTCAIRTVLPPMSLIPAVRKAVANVDPYLPLPEMTTQKILFKKQFRLARLFASLCGSLALLALSLSCIGLYGIMAYNVARRTSEMGIRKALGARPLDVAWSILREALKLATIGVAIGMLVAMALVCLIEGLIYGIEPHDPLTMIGAAVIMVAVAALAAWIPARRAARIDPMEALRYE